jgi:lipoate-protein ligase A
MEVAESFVQGFHSTFQLDFVESEPTQAELKRARELTAEKYAADRWTYKL